MFQQLSKIRGRVKFQGIAAVKPGTILKLQGVGDRFNGKVYITAINHHISEGNWTVDAQFGINPRWFSETYDINSMPASGLLSGICGIQIGIVSQLEEDPDGENRILVQIPIVNSEEQGIWCRVASLDAGENRGAFFLPEISDEVIVGFINDDPNDGVVLGMLHSSAKPAPIEALDDNHEKGFVTRSNMRVHFNDDTKTITIDTPAGNVIKLDEESTSITIEDQNGNTTTMDSSGTSMNSATDIKIEASGKIDIKAGAAMTLAAAQMAISAQSSMEVKGATAKLAGDGITEIKGSIVNIN
jgi:uncharacterized protein involved in type VI secretion and phage assembly